jgi:hypothetical protein
VKGTSDDGDDVPGKRLCAFSSKGRWCWNRCPLDCVVHLFLYAAKGSQLRSLPNSELLFLFLSLLGSLMTDLRLQSSLLSTRCALFLNSDLLSGCADPYTGGADGPGRVCPTLLLSKYLNAGSMATMIETYDSV